jgi:alpha-ribazole phosphatase
MAEHDSKGTADESPTVIIISRHPLTDFNKNGIVQGARSNTQLGTEGKEQAQKLAKELLKYKIDVIFSSPLDRCVQGVDPYAKASNLPVHYAKGLTERNYGLFDGATKESYDEWKKKNNANNNYDLAPPEGQSFREFRKQVAEELNPILKKYKGKTILIMGHSATDIAVLLTIFNQKEESNYDKYKFDNASITIVEIKDGKPELKMLNSTSHLGKQLSKSRSI